MTQQTIKKILHQWSLWELLIVGSLMWLPIAVLKKHYFSDGSMHTLSTDFWHWPYWHWRNSCNLLYLMDGYRSVFSHKLVTWEVVTLHSTNACLRMYTPWITGKVACKWVKFFHALRPSFTDSQICYHWQEENTMSWNY